MIFNKKFDKRLYYHKYVFHDFDVQNKICKNCERIMIYDSSLFNQINSLLPQEIDNFFISHIKNKFAIKIYKNVAFSYEYMKIVDLVSCFSEEELNIRNIKSIIK